MLFFTSPHIGYLLLLLISFLSLAASQTAQCDLENMYTFGDIAIPSEVTSEPMFQDDYSKILTPEEQAQELQSRRRRAAVRDRSRIWPDNTIPYIIDSDFQEHSVALLKRAMQTWSDVSCIRFVARTTEQDYLHIKSGRRCCSYVGRQKLGAQKMALDQGCMLHGILLHELGHVIGFWHEQNRPDRDEYIQVLPNYHESVSYNFDKRNESEVHDYGVEYDYSSIMHYGQTFFSIDGKSTTLKPLKPNVQIGQRQGLSPLDILQANRLYMCQDDCNWSYNASEQAGSFQSMNYPEKYPPKMNCITRLYANEGQVIRVNFETIKLEHHSACKYDFLEVRDGDFATSPLLGHFCGDLPPKNFTSTGPYLWIKFHSDSSVSKDGFFAHYVAFDKEKTQVTKINPCELKTCAHSCDVIDGTATCLCPLGFRLSEDGFTCRDVNECMYNNGGCSHICHNSKGSFTCHCPRGYLLGDNSLTCIDINECSSGQHRCDQVCTNTPGSYYCDCRPGYTLSRADFTSCNVLTECSALHPTWSDTVTDPPLPVQHGQSITLSCKAGFTNNGGSTATCRSGQIVATESERPPQCVAECSALHPTWSNTVTDPPLPVQHGQSITLSCKAGYTNNGGSTATCRSGQIVATESERPPQCVDSDECEANKGGCEHNCTNLVGGFECYCVDGYILDTEDNVSCNDVDECQDNNGGCDQICENTPGGHYCSCEPGYELDSSTNQCVDIDECSDGSNGGCEQNCHNFPGASSCSCRTGFTLVNGTRCQDIDECETVQCVDGTCVNELGTYHCRCDDYQTLHPTNNNFCIYGLRTEEDEENLTEDNSFRLGSNVQRTNKYSNPVCGNEEVRGEPGIITSPHYPSFYPTSTRCSWLISGRTHEKVQITLQHFDLERMRYCSYDSLRIYDGPNERYPYMYNLCGIIKSEFAIASSGQDLFLKFKSDIMNRRPGFSAALDFIALNRCGGRYITTRQTRKLALKSQDSRQCMWSLSSPGSSILLNFIKFNFRGSTWSGTACTLEDSLEIYSTVDRTLIARFCKTSPPPKLYISHTSQITIIVRALSEGTSMDLLLLYSATSLKYV